MKIYEAQVSWIVKEDIPDSQLNRPELVAEYMKSAFALNPVQESVWVVLLNRKNYAIGRQMITLGTATSSLCHPREILRAAIVGNATAFCLVHNHPSGDPAPSSADVMVTRQIREAARAVDIDFQDHVIVGTPEADPNRRGIYSFREAGII